LAAPARFARLEAGGTPDEVREQILQVLELRGW
jgi:hypothetical protein